MRRAPALTRPTWPGLAPALVQTLALTLVAGLALMAPAMAAPLDLTLPQPATQTTQAAASIGELLLPSGPWADGAIPGARLPGRITQTAWRIDQPLPTVDVMQRLRADVLAAGYRITFECQTETCGGFDFRYALPVLPEPDMHVDLGDFRFLAAQDGDQAVTLLVSRSDSAAYVQITLVGPRPAAPALKADASASAGADASGGAAQAPDAAPGALVDAAPAPDAPAPAPAAPGSLAQALETQGHAALDDLAFASGKAALQPGTYASLTDLAAWLIAHPAATVALVGHTDATGSLSGNIALSKARAAAVRAALIDLGVPAAQLAAEGMGYLAPRASNLTEEGRRQNRRVEVVLTSTQLLSATESP